MSIVVSGLATLHQAAYLADDTDVGDETHKAGPIAILVIAVLCIGCFLLFRSMSRHLRRVRDGFPGQPGEAPVDAAAGEPDPADPGEGDAPAAEQRPPGSTRPAPKSRSRTPDDTAAR